MTTLKLDGTPGAGALAALEAHIPGIYRDPTKRVVAIIELAHVERVQPAPDTEKEPSVKVRLSQCELPGDADGEDAIREAMRALYVRRTARGTIDEAGELELSASTVARLGDNLDYAATARLAAGARYWADYAAEVVAKRKPTISDLLGELRQLRAGLTALADGRSVDKGTGEVLDGF